MQPSEKVKHFISQKKSEDSSGNAEKGFLPGTLPFVTITRQSGAGGHLFANRLLELLDERGGEHDVLSKWRVFDRNMCQQVMDEEHLEISINELLNEDYHSQIKEFVLGIFGDYGMQNVAYVRLSQLLRTVASVGKVIVLGHGAQMATRELAGGLHVYLVAPLPVRAKRIAQSSGRDESQVMEDIKKQDEKQRKLLKTHYRIDSAAPENYDLVVNTDRVSPETAAELMLTLLAKRLKINPT